jgi:hypothetical protein
MERCLYYMRASRTLQGNNQISYPLNQAMPKVARTWPKKQECAAKSRGWHALRCSEGRATRRRFNGKSGKDLYSFAFGG